MLGNASRFSSTQANLLLTAEKKKWALTTYIFTSKAEKLFWTLIFGTGLWKTRRKLWTSCSTDQTGGDQKRREEKIKEKKERKSHCSTQNKPSHRAWWTLGLRNRVEVGFHSTWAFHDWNRLYGSIIIFFGQSRLFLPINTLSLKIHCKKNKK